MKTQAQIEEMLKEVMADERLGYPTATVFENAPLAMVQLELETKRDLLREILEREVKDET